MNYTDDKWLKRVRAVEAMIPRERFRRRLALHISSAIDLIAVALWVSGAIGNTAFGVAFMSSCIGYVVAICAIDRWARRVLSEINRDR